MISALLGMPLAPAISPSSQTLQPSCLGSACHLIWLATDLLERLQHHLHEDVRSKPSETFTSLSSNGDRNACPVKNGDDSSVCIWVCTTPYTVAIAH